MTIEFQGTKNIREALLEKEWMQTQQDIADEYNDMLEQEARDQNPWFLSTDQERGNPTTAELHGLTELPF